MTGAQPLLRAADLQFGYNHEGSVIDGWSHSFERGESVALVGPSGRGKSTLLYLLSLMLTPSAGEVLLAGQATSKLHDRERARLRAEHFGFVFQDAALDPTRTVLDNVMEPSLYRAPGPEDLRQRAHDLLNRFGVLSRADHKPGQISGGQAQRIALCRALLTSPSVVFADEPTGNLDTNSSATVIDALNEHAVTDSGAVVVIVTHDQRVAERCGRVISL